jgi:hypothetical protein
LPFVIWVKSCCIQNGWWIWNLQTLENSENCNGPLSRSWLFGEKIICLLFDNSYYIQFFCAVNQIFILFSPTRFLSTGYPRRVGPNHRPVQVAVRWQTERKVSGQVRPDHLGRPQRWPHRPDVRLFPRRTENWNQNHQV